MRQIDRLHYMDSLRAVAMFLGLVLHGSIVFAQWNVDFIRTHDEPSAFVRFFPEMVHVFRMQLFFLVAGFFSMMICQKRGVKSYAANRFKRIFIPFVVCVLVIQPWMAAHYYVDISFSENSVLSQYFNFLLQPSYVVKETMMTGNWFWHFWFMHILIYFIATFLIGRVVVQKLGLKIRWITKFLGFIGSKLGVFVLALITYPLLLISAPFSEVPTIGTSLEMLCYYGLFFFFGVLFVTDVKIFDRFQSNIKYHIIPFIVCLYILFPMFDAMRLKGPPELLLQNFSLYTGVESQSKLLGAFPVLQNPFNFSGLSASLDWHLLCLIRAYTTWCAIILFIVFFKKFFSKESALSRYAADSSYFIYLIHFPIQLSLSYYLRDRVDSVIAGFWISVVATTLICVVLYHFICRSTPIGTLLSGRKYSLSILSEWDEFKKLFTKKPIWIGLITLTIASVAADRIESNIEKKLLYFSSHAKPEKVKEYITGKSPEELSKIKHLGGRNAMHMVAYNMPVARPDEKIAESVRLLLGVGLDPMSRDDFGQTPLHYAVRNGNEVALGLLLEAGADPNAADAEYGSTPLHLAATLKADDLIRDLVAAGADPGLARKNGENAEEIYEKYHSKPFPAE